MVSGGFVLGPSEGLVLALLLRVDARVDEQILGVFETLRPTFVAVPPDVVAPCATPLVGEETLPLFGSVISGDKDAAQLEMYTYGCENGCSASTNTS